MAKSLREKHDDAIALCQKYHDEISALDSKLEIQQLLILNWSEGDRKSVNLTDEGLRSSSDESDTSMAALIDGLWGLAFEKREAFVRLTDKKLTSQLRADTKRRNKVLEMLDKAIKKGAELSQTINLQSALIKRVEADIAISEITREQLGKHDGMFTDSTLADFTRHARRVARSTRVASLAKDALEESRAWLRTFVMGNNTGWTKDTNVFKCYRFARAGKLMVVLQDSVSYSMALELAIDLMGLEQLRKLGLLKVDNTALRKAIEAGAVQTFLTGAMPVSTPLPATRRMTIEDWFTHRDRKVNSPVVVVSEEDAVGSQKVVVIKEELMATPVDKLPELTSLTGHHVNRLIAAGIQLVSELKGMALVDLVDFAGIGPVRATEIIDEVTRVLG